MKTLKLIIVSVLISLSLASCASTSCGFTKTEVKKETKSQMLT